MRFAVLAPSPVLVTGLLAAFLVAAAARADDAVKPGPVSSTSSVQRLVESTASALEARALVEHVSGGVHVEVSAGRGIDAAKLEKAFAPRLRRRLHEGGLLLPAPDVPMHVRVVVSEEGALVWAVAALEGGALPGPTTVAVSVHIDRELQASLGASARGTRNRWGLERIATLPAGILDVLLLDLDNDGVDELIALSVDGLRLYRFVQGAMHLERQLGPVRLPGEKRWPRVVVGWLARAPGGLVWCATSAGHLALFDPRAGKIDAATDGNVPLRQAASTNADEGVLFAKGHVGSPVLSLPLSTAKGGVVSPPGMPPHVRDVVRWPSRADVWVWVDDAGALAGRSGNHPVQSLATELVGDRVLAADLDGDGGLELLTSSVSSPGESDHLVLRRVDPDVTTSTVLFRSPLSGGAVVAAALGRLDLDGHLDALVVEETGGEALVWRLEHAR